MIKDYSNFTPKVRPKMADIRKTTNSEVMHAPNWVHDASHLVKFVPALPKYRVPMPEINQFQDYSARPKNTEKSLRTTLGLALAMALNACALTPPPCPGTRASDIQVCRGEKPLRIPNFYMEAIQRANKCEQCIDIETNCYHGLPPQCRPKWKSQ